MQSAGLAQKQQLRVIPLQIQANAILSMNVLELQQFIEMESVENPALSVEEGCRCPVCGFVVGEDVSCPVCGACKHKIKEPDGDKRGERDYLERAFAAVDREFAYDPFRTVARATDLNEYLRQQAMMNLGGRQLRIAEYLIDSLDDDGYFRESLFETAEEFATAVPEIEEVLRVLQGFDPPGIAARDLRECLLIQLRSLTDAGPAASDAERIFLDYWNDFSKMKYKTIAGRMGVPITVVEEACRLIKDNLTPYPASIYRGPFDELSPRRTPAVAPDIVVHAKGHSLIAEVVDRQGALLGIDRTYDELYAALGCPDCCLSDDDRKHVKEQVERVRCILEAIELRKKTLARVAVMVVDYQSEFILHGPPHLKPLRQKDVAAALGLHESTVCRALANKYCRLPSGEVISFEVFFDSALPIRTMISQLAAKSAKPLSDGEIASRLAEQGVTIARRTVAKYRQQINLLPYHLRAA